VGLEESGQAETIRKLERQLGQERKKNATLERKLKFMTQKYLRKVEMACEVNDKAIAEARELVQKKLTQDTVTMGKKFRDVTVFMQQSIAESHDLVHKLAREAFTKFLKDWEEADASVFDTV